MKIDPRGFTQDFYPILTVTLNRWTLRLWRWWEWKHQDPQVRHVGYLSIYR